MVNMGRKVVYGQRCMEIFKFSNRKLRPAVANQYFWRTETAENLVK